MPKKTKITFITTFIVIGLIALGVYFWFSKDQKTNENGETPWYQSFNPFGTGGDLGETEPNTNNVDENGNPIDEEKTKNSKFHQITDFAISGATFLEETRPIKTDGVIQPPQPEEIKTIISADTKEGRKDIQIFLNKELSLNPPLVVDGNFGKLATQAIKDFQKSKNIKITGKVDTETAPYFIKITQKIDDSTLSQFEQAPSLRFVERKNGHIYKMFLDTKTQEKISNSTIPSIYESLFNNKGETVIYRYLSEDKIINSFLATLGASKGEFLPQNISDISVSMDKTKFFYLIKNSNGTTGNIGIFGDEKRSVVFNHPFTEWISQWDNKQNVYLTTKSSYSVPGSVFLLNTSTGTINKLFGGIEGLTTSISPNGSLILYSYTTTTGPKLGLFNIKEHSTKDLDAYGLSEKCTWSSSSVNIYCAIPNVINGYQYPDRWYQGLESFDDFFVKINTETLEKTTIADSTDGTPVDGTYLFLDKEESSLFFTNKKDSTLWSLDIE